MKMREHEKLYNTAKFANEVNNIIVDSSLELIEKHHDDEVLVTNELGILKKGLKSREEFNNTEREFEKRKAWREGYIVATVGAVIGVIIGEYVSPKVISKLKKN